jgi:hypothetical protein
MQASSSRLLALERETTLLASARTYTPIYYVTGVFILFPPTNEVDRIGGENKMISQEQQQQQQSDSVSTIAKDKNQVDSTSSATEEEKWDHALVDEANQSSLTLESLTEEAKTSSGIPAVRFIEDIDTFSNSFTPPASAELLIGAYSDLFSRYKRIEENLNQKSKFCFYFSFFFLFFPFFFSHGILHIYIMYKE